MSDIAAALADYYSRRIIQQPLRKAENGADQLSEVRARASRLKDENASLRGKCARLEDENSRLRRELSRYHSRSASPAHARL